MIIISTFNFNNPASGRNYDKDSVNKAFTDYINRYNNDDKLMVGELGSESSQNEISLSQISHKIKTISNDDGNITIEAELLDTPMGKIAQQMVDNGVSLSIRPRMLGYTDEVTDENDEVIGYKTIINEIISWDIWY